MAEIDLLIQKTKADIIGFAQELVRTKSYSGDEEKIVKLIEKKMKELGYDEIKIDKMGNLVGIIGNGDKIIMFDSHVDTVQVNNADDWELPPFGGEIVNNHLYGRGSVDMKSSIAASVYSVALAKKLGLIKGLKIVVSCSVFEEDCDGENLKHLFNEFNLKPDCVVICEPSSNLITLGHKGKAQIIISTKGVSAHGSAPEDGINAVYEMAEIIQRVEKTNKKLNNGKESYGTLVLSNISSKSASLNAVPTECEIYLDRRLILGENIKTIEREMNQILKGKDAQWQLGTLNRISWTGLNISYKPYHEAWKIDLNDELTKMCIKSYKEVFNEKELEFDYWDFSTNAVTPVSMGIPCIGFGPGNHKLAHMINENCSILEIVDACRFYLTLILNFELSITINDASFQSIR